MGLSFNVRGGMSGRELFSAGGTAGRCALAEAPATGASLKERFPRLFYLSELVGWGRNCSEVSIGVVEERQHPALVAICV